MTKKTNVLYKLIMTFVILVTSPFGILFKLLGDVNKMLKIIIGIWEGKRFMKICETIAQQEIESLNTEEIESLNTAISQYKESKKLLGIDDEDD